MADQTDQTEAMAPSDETTVPARTPLYSYYVLAVLMVIYAFNFLDRQIITILAPSLKADLGLSDAQLGLLFGTAFALFYALFGIPLAKLADGWHRVRTISLGLGFWSGMTAVSGLATNFAQLGSARVGVGIGEASAGPAAYSLIQDYFPKAKRATAIAIYSAGIYLGVGASLALGGEVISYWDTTYTEATRPFGIAGWQATFLAFGIPGLLLAVLVLTTIREPIRGAMDGVPSPAVAPRPFAAVGRELAAMFPPFSMITVARGRAAERRPLIVNIAMFVGLIVVAVALVGWTDAMLPPEKRAAIATFGGFELTTNMVQWGAIAIGVYGSFSWLQSLAHRDPVATRLIGNRTFGALALVGGLASFASYGLSPFVYVYMVNVFGVGPEEGRTLGWILASAGMLGVFIGGWASDRARRLHPAGRLYMVIAALVVSAILLYFQFTTESRQLFLTLLWIVNFLQIMWLAPVAATTQDMVLPRMRGTAAAVFFLGTNIIGLGMGPYCVGLVADVTGDLRFAMLSVLFVAPVTIGLLIYSARKLPAVEASIIDRARAAGEDV